MMQTAAAVCTETGVSGLLLPPGMLAMVGREIPFASALFYIRPLLSQCLMDSFPGADQKLSIVKELTCGCLTSIIATPLSHPPSVIAAYQQAHSIGLVAAIRGITARDGHIGLWRGLLARTVALAGTFTVVPIIVNILSR